MNDTQEESFSDVERELLRLKPRPATSQMHARIKASLDRPLPAHRSFALLALAASLLVAAALIGLLISRQSTPAIEPRIVQIPSTIDSSQPTLLAYRQALGRSEQDLFALLDEHGASRTSNASHIAAPPSLSPFSRLETMDSPSSPDSSNPSVHPFKDRS